jgi:hypothetical protein
VLNLDKLILLVLRRGVLLVGLAELEDRLAVGVKDLVLLLDQLVGLSHFEALDGLRESLSQDLAALARSTRSIE